MTTAANRRCRQPRHFPRVRFLLACLLGCQLLQSFISARASDSVFAWGDNNFFQSQPPAGLSDVRAVAGGVLHSLALKADGTVVGWGDNLFNETNTPPGLTNVIAIGAGDSYSLALRSNGTVAVWGDQSAAPAGLTNVTAIAAGWRHALALKRDGTVISWGELTEVPAGLSNVVAIAAGDDYSLALLKNVTVVAWGANSTGPINVPSDLANVVAISAGRNHVLALQRNGTLVAWGDNSDGQTDVPAGLTNVVGVAAGAYHSLALRGNSTLAAWGNNTYFQSVVPGWTGFFGIAAGAYHNLGLLGDGAPRIVLQPRSQSVPTTETATFYATAAAALPMVFQWQRNGTNIVGANKTTLTLNNVLLSDAGIYTMTASNSAGVAVSANAVLTPFLTPPYIIIQPQDQNIICGEAATFAVTAGGTALNYQWHFEGSLIAGATATNLFLNHVRSSDAGGYSVVVANPYGSITSVVATLTAIPVAPLITSPLTASGAQGQSFNYAITALHSPTLFTATDLPLGLGINTNSGVISGTPLDSGTFTPTITAATDCASQSETLVLTINSSAPVITSPLISFGQEDQVLIYQITATGLPTTFGAQGLPVGLSLNRTTGLIVGQPIYGGNFDATISATNSWGSGAATLRFTITNKPLTGLSIANVTYAYSTPYLLDFEFSLRDNDDPAQGNAVVVDPKLLSVVCLEDKQPISPTETAVLVNRGTAKQLKANLVLDFTQSIASLSNGDADRDGISDAVEAMVSGAQTFVNEQPASVQMGVYEFHREDFTPKQVVPLTMDKALLNQSIAGIWTNYVKGFPAASRCWDALTMAIANLGATNRDEQHYVVFVSDGRDESSFSYMTNVIAAATNNGVKIYCIGFGDEIDTNNLIAITSETQGRYYEATNAVDLQAQFEQVSKDVNGQYLLRWATLKRFANVFMPSFQVTYQGLTALSPTNPVVINIDTTTVPPITNSVTNFIIAPYTPNQHFGTVTAGALRLSADAAVLPTAITLRAAYVPRFIRQLRLHYRSNWPCTVSLLSTAPGELLAGWTLTQTNDGAGGQWLQIVSRNPQSVANSLPFAALGNLIHFNFRDGLNASNAFSLFAVDNTLYTNTGGQSFVIENASSFIKVYPVLPYQTPVPWLIDHGITNNFDAAEVADPDGDGVPTWKEYVANTDPQNAASYFAVKGLSTDIYGRNQVTFSTSLNRVYRVESSADLVIWETVQDNLPGTGGNLTVLDHLYPPPTQQFFYRAVVY